MNQWIKALNFFSSFWISTNISNQEMSPTPELWITEFSKIKTRVVIEAGQWTVVLLINLLAHADIWDCTQKMNGKSKSSSRMSETTCERCSQVLSGPSEDTERLIQTMTCTNSLRMMIINEQVKQDMFRLDTAHRTENIHHGGKQWCTLRTLLWSVFLQAATSPPPVSHVLLELYRWLWAQLVISTDLKWCKMWNTDPQADKL